MIKYLQDKLILSHPVLFPPERKSQKSSPFLAWGIECDDGWYDLIDELFGELSEYLLKYKVKNFEIMQIKQKFAFLTVYTNLVEKESDNKAIYKIVDKYKKKSLDVCEITGKPGKVMCRGYWLKTLCKEQAVKLGYAELTDKNNTESH